MKDYNIEMDRNKPIIRHVIFMLTTLLFLIASFFSISDIYSKRPLLESNIIYFIVYMLALGLIFTTIIMNMYKYSQIKQEIKAINEQDNALKAPGERPVYTKTVWIYPIVSLIYFIILIMFLIIINHKCGILKNNISSYYYEF